MAFALAILELLSPCLTTESERREAFGCFYEAAMEALNKYEERRGRELARLRPSAN